MVLKTCAHCGKRFSAYDDENQRLCIYCKNWYLRHNGAVKIAVDFDGTIVDHRYPDIGPFAPYALEYLSKWQDNPAVELCLYTMRCANGPDGDTLGQAVKCCGGMGIVFDIVNSRESDREWTSSPKLYAHVYIDDAAAGTPMIHPASFKRPCVDWSVIGPLVDAKIEEHSEKLRVL